MWEIAQHWLQALVLAGGGGAVAAWAIFRYLGTRWMDDRFATRLEAVRHEYAKETEKTKLEISKQLDRATKLSQREFEILPALWAEIIEAVALTNVAYLSFMSYPDLSNENDEKTKGILSRSILPEHHQAEILGSPKDQRNDLFGKAIQIHRAHEARAQVVQADTSLKRGAIFLPKALHDELRALADQTWKAVVEIEMNLRPRQYKDSEGEKLRTESPVIIARLEDAIRERLKATA